MNYWFVNLGTYYKEQREGRYLWAPLRDRTGKILNHWDSLKDVNRGDIIICNNGGIVSVAVAKDHAYLSDIPDEFEHTWQKEGRRIDLRFIDLEKPLNYIKYKDYILKNIDPDKNPFDIKGHAKLGYLYPLDEKIAIFLLDKMNNDEINNLLDINSTELKEEIEEYQEEQEQFEKINNGSVQEYTNEELDKIEKNNKNYKYVEKTKSKEKVLKENADSRLKETRMKAANYLCEINPNHKTFTNSSGKHQYLESHHIVPMKAQKYFTDIKLDSFFNLISLCPVCHRQVHHANLEEKRDIFYRMYEIRKKEMLEHGFDKETIDAVFNRFYK